jgi:hypothetical protein
MPGSHDPRPKKNRDTLHNEPWLRNRYLDEGRSATEIARELGCSKQSVLWAVRKFGIPVRPMSESKRGRPSTTEWTPEMRESLAEQRRGESNPFHGKVSPHRGPNWHPDQRIRNLRSTRAFRRGVTGVEYDAMLERQGGVCAICHQPETRKAKGGTPYTLGVDHNHATGQIRDLLCMTCNSAIGLAADDPMLLRAMADYLERHRSSG